jgi:hypothetical protein
LFVGTNGSASIGVETGLVGAAIGQAGTMLNVTALGACIGANNHVEYRCIAHAGVVSARIEKLAVVYPTVLSITALIDEGPAQGCVVFA